MDQLPISPKGFEMLQAELKRLKTEEKPKIIFKTPVMKSPKAIKYLGFVWSR